MSFFDSVEHFHQATKTSLKGEWQNWSGNVHSFPARLYQPVSTSELAAELKQSQGPYRVVGSGHSFSPLAKTKDTLISLNQMAGLLGHDKDKHSARIMAGTALHQLSPLLDEINQGMLNMGDINHQSIAGAIATGTHGTGANLPCLSALVKSLTLITAEGKVIECSKEHNSRLFNAARVNLGCLGIVTEVELQNGPAYSLQETIELQPLDDILNSLDQLKAQHRHVEFFALPYSDQAILKTLNPTKSEPVKPKQDLISEDALLKIFCEASQRFPKLIPFIHRQVARFVKPSHRIDNSHKVFATPRTVKFNEMEYQVPVEHGAECLRQIFKHIREQQLPAFFPVEFRFVTADTIWMSPFYRQDSASISIHQYAKQDYLELFGQIEPIFDAFQGRPHWGKIHTKTSTELETLYPRWNDWLAIREELDPDQQFLSPEMRQLLGIHP